MGIDLNFYVEIEGPPGRWLWRGGSRPQKGSPLHEDFFVPRNPAFYRIFERRVLPENLSDVLRHHLRHSLGDAPETDLTWVGLDELIDLDVRVPPRVRYIYEPFVAHVREIGWPPEKTRIIVELY